MTKTKPKERASGHSAIKRAAAPDARRDEAEPSEGPEACKSKPPAPGLYLVATPIGNLGDITLRALELLKSAHAILCEDSRVTAKLLRHYGISKPLLAYHDHNAEAMRPKILERLAVGESLALVSDAGTPLISDPGYKLVREAIGRGFAVTALPGASASLTALQLSGLPSDRFLFAGFLPPRGEARRKALVELAPIAATLIFYESAARLPESLQDMVEIMGDRPAAVARELTKLFEEVRRAPLSELAQYYEIVGPPKGELVLLVGPADRARASPTPAELDAALERALATASLRDAVAAVAAATGLPKRTIYARALGLQKSTAGPDDNRR